MQINYKSQNIKINTEKKPKPNLTPKKIKTILDWTKQESIKTNEYEQKLPHLDIG